MPKLTNSQPKYRLHKASGQAVVTLAGKDQYLGKHNTEESRRRYDKLVGEWLAAGRPSRRPDDTEILVSEFIVDYYSYAKKHYRRSDGTPTGTAQRIKYPLRLLREHYGDAKVSDFGPRALKHLQQVGIERGSSRSYINDNISRIQTCFKWGVSEELFDESVHRRLMSVQPLERGKSDAKETDPVEFVDDAIVDQTVLQLHGVVADMVRFQRLTGARPGEVCSMKLHEIDREKDCWVYQPPHHKNEHRRKDRRIYIGPKAQQLLVKYLDRDPSDYIFTPSEGREAHLKRRNKRRVTPPKQGNRRAEKAKGSSVNRKKCYQEGSYRQAIHRACGRAFPPVGELQKMPGETKAQRDARLSAEQHEALKAWDKEHRWSPNQLRHTMATETRKEFGLEGVMATLGHSNASTSSIYAERNCVLAAEIATLYG